jgi:hypothetical protein
MNTAASWRDALARAFTFHDWRAWALIALCVFIAWLVDPAIVKTVVEWIVIFGLFVGLPVMLSRHVLPMIDLAALVQQVMMGNTAAGLTVLALLHFLALLILALTLWAKT